MLMAKNPNQLTRNLLKVSGLKILCFLKSVQEAERYTHLLKWIKCDSETKSETS